MTYQIWARSTTMNNADRWHAQSVHADLTSACLCLEGLQRTYPNHQLALTPHAGSFPVTAAQWSDLISRTID
jgi:hypothetical protein